MGMIVITRRMVVPVEQAVRMSAVIVAVMAIIIVMIVRSVAVSRRSHR